MAMQQLLAKLLALSVAVLVMMSSPIAGTASCPSLLQVGHYRQSCPAAESVVRATVEGYFSRDPTVTAPLLRLHFHDCFVRATAGNTSGASLWEVPTGRRDGRVSAAAEAVANLPSSFADFAKLKKQFASKGLNVNDLAILSGAHAIGNSHCASFAKRLYNFTGNGDADPSLDASYAAALRASCPPRFDNATTVEMVPGSSTSFDAAYYKLVASHRGLFHSDQALLQDQQAGAVVYSLLGSSKKKFLHRFGASMVRMGRAGVLTGSAGEIRKSCALVN
ncbi:hypothetical protein ABZP36_000482 [Zizania latifolia]